MKNLSFISSGYTIVKTPAGSQYSFRGTTPEQLEEQAQELRNRIARYERQLAAVQSFIEGNTVSDPAALR